MSSGRAIFQGGFYIKKWGLTQPNQPRQADAKNPNHPSFSSVSVRCRRASSFKRRLTDTYVLGNLPNTGTGFLSAPYFLPFENDGMGSAFARHRRASVGLITSGR